MRLQLRQLYITVVLLLICGCSATRYVPEGEYLLSSNKVILNESKGNKINKSELEEYIQQSPNRRLLGLGIYLGFYNMTDTSKHTGWHKFWSEKIGEAPVILDTTKISRSSEEMQLYMQTQGYLNANISDTVEIKENRKATVKYNVDSGKPFTIAEIEYNIQDSFIAEILEDDIVQNGLKSGANFQRQVLENERTRITNKLRDIGFWSFNQNYITYIADSTLGNNTVNIRLELAQMVVGQDQRGGNIYANHPIYRIRNRTINSNYDPMVSPESNNNSLYDSVRYKGVEILYRDKLLIKEKLLFNQLGISKGEYFSQSEFEQTVVNMRSLDLNPTILFSQVPEDSSDIVIVTTPLGEASTTQRELDCLIQCVKNVSQNFSVGFEASTTSDYYSTALTLGYQHRNLFGGAENFNVSLRGAYEFTKAQQGSNSFEVGVETSISIPRFWLPISLEKMRGFDYSSTNLTLSYEIQRRTYYQRTIFSAVYGYGWTMKNGGRFTINPADINLVSVPWIDEDYIASIENPYLYNSYTTQLIAGLSATYNYRTNPDLTKDGYSFSAAFDINGNLFTGINSLFGSQKYYNAESNYYYYNLLGLQYAQYARLSLDLSNRVSMGSKAQFAWRFLVAGGYAYGNSRSLPYERLFYAGGSSSMRGWQVRTLGPGGVYIASQDEYPEQLGDFKLELNAEFRFNVVGGFNGAIFFDCGNVWMNSSEESDANANFEFHNFYNELGFNTGIGVRYDFNFFILRLDWGWKLRNPNNIEGQRWFKNLALDQTALHFAIGLPF